MAKVYIRPDPLGNVAGCGLLAAASFLLLIGVLVTSPPLFYMSTALVATILAARVQAAIAVRGLSFERFVPDTVSVGDEVKVELMVNSDRKWKRPLIRLIDLLPQKMAAQNVSSSLPVAASFGQHVMTQYTFRPARRGVFRWTDLIVTGTDALGLVHVSVPYTANESVLTVFPTPIPIAADVLSSFGWGFTETDSGRSYGTGLEPVGVRGYTQGDSVRYVHWRSTARRGSLHVKEFAVGSTGGMTVLIQTTRGTDVGEGTRSSLERMCGHAAYLGERLIEGGLEVRVAGMDYDLLSGALPYEKKQKLMTDLTQIDCTSPKKLSAELDELVDLLEPGAGVLVMIVALDEALPAAIRKASANYISVHVIAYDANSFVPARHKLSFPSAGDLDYISGLKSAGARVTPYSLEPEKRNEDL